MVSFWTVSRWVVVYLLVYLWTVSKWVVVYIAVSLWTVSWDFPLFSYAELEFIWWQFTMVFEKIISIVWEFVCYPCGYYCKIIVKDDENLWRNISSFEIQNQSDTSWMLRQYTKINGLYWLRLPFWNRFLLTKFGVEDEARRSKSMKMFHSSISFCWQKML